MGFFTSLAIKNSPAQPVALAVAFELTDLESKPIQSASVRVVFGRERDWQTSVAGQHFETDTAGKHRLEAQVVLEKRMVKRPTNFIDSLFQWAEPANSLQVAAELEYAGHRWLYVVDVHYFRRDGTVLLNGLSVFTPDAHGDFTVKAKASGSGWTMADLGGLVLASPGHQVTDFTLQPDPAEPEERKWNLTLSFKRHAAPVFRK